MFKTRVGWVGLAVLVLALVGCGGEKATEETEALELGAKSTGTEASAQMEPKSGRGGRFV